MFLDRPASFGVHRLMIPPPRDGHDMLQTSSLAVSPAPNVRWKFDTFGNSAALLTFPKPADELVRDAARSGRENPSARLEFARLFPVSIGVAFQTAFLLP